MLGAAPVLADAIVEQLCRNTDRAADARQLLGAASEAEADYLAANVWRAVWPVERCAGPPLRPFGTVQHLPVMLGKRATLMVFLSLSSS